MKKILLTVSIILLSFLFVFVPKAEAKVATMETGSYVVSEDEVIDDDLFVGAETVEIRGTVNGDVYIGASTVLVDGIINGDLHVGAGTFNLSGVVQDDVYIGSGNVTVTGAEIGDSLHVGTGNLTIDEETSIGGSLLVGAGNILTKAYVQRNMMIGAGNIDLDSEVGGEVRVAGGQITVGSNTKVGKDFYYTLGDEDAEIKMADGATVSGMVKEIENKYVKSKDWNGARDKMSSFARGAGYATKVVSYIGAFIIGFLMLKFMPKKSASVSETIRKSFWSSLGAGLIATFLIIPVLILLAVTVVGLPLAGITILLFLIKTYLAKIVVGISLGKWVSGKFNWKNMSSYMTFAIGLLLVYVLKAFYFIGFFASLVILWSGLGAQILYHKEKLASKK